jgi:DNA helicase-4
MMSQEKRRYWKSKQNWELLEYTPANITDKGEGSFIELLKIDLEQHGIACNRLSEDEIWIRIRDRAIDRFTNAAVNFVGRCRKQSLHPHDLQRMIAAYKTLSLVEYKFLKIISTLYDAYLRRLAATGEEDFDGLMQRAISKVSKGLTRFDRRSGSGDLASLQFVCIDEFQDFSDLFYRLLCAIREINSRIELFCVGDDWQAINEFAGSDLRFFEQFDNYIGQTRHLSISTNYRSLKSIVRVGNALMQGLGCPAVSDKEIEGKVLLADISEFNPSMFELQRYPGDTITPMVSRIANASLAMNADVVMLCRCNILPWYIHFDQKNSGKNKGLGNYLDLIRSLFAKDLRGKISISTAHKYKGLQKATVIVMDAVARSYPLIHPDWIFARILGDDPIKLAKADRRLLYVALTRAVEKLVIITDSQCTSPFLGDVSRSFPLRHIDWDQYPPLRNESNRIVVAVKNQEHFKGTPPTIVIKDQLKAAGYRYQCKNHASWEKIFSTQHFCLERLMSEVWAEAADGIEVRVFDELENVVGIFRINDGQWTTYLDKLASIDSTQETNEVQGAYK